MELGPFPVMLLLIILIHCVQPQELKKAVISTNPANPVYVGENVYLTCLVEGDSVNTFHYHWKKEDSVSPATSEPVHKINSVEESHAGNYTCEVTAEDGSHFSQTTDVLTLTVLVPPEASITTWPQSSVFTGEPVSLNCEVKGFNGWKYNWYKKNTATSLWTSVTESENYTINKHGLNISRDAVVNGDKYRCRGERFHRPSTTQYSPEVTIIAKALPRATISVDPQGPVFTGESVTLKCEVKAFDGWTYQWDKHSETQQWIPLVQSVHYTVNRDTVIISRDSVVNGEQYRCRGERPGRPSASQYSTVTLTVKAVKPKPELTSSLQGAALIGNPVILYCKLEQSAGWRFYWSKHTQNPDNETSTETSSTIISSVTSSDGGQYWCRAGRGNPVYYTHYSDALWINVTGVSSLVSLIINPNRSQHFSGHSLSLSCVDQSHSTAWTVLQYTQNRSVSDCSSGWGSVTGSTCTISSLSTSHTGVYWCQSESAGSNNPVNITVHDGDVILDSPVHPVTEGDSLTLRCLCSQTPSNLTVSFYKDGSPFQTQTTGQITIRAVSKSDDGLYYCKYPESRESPHSWISVRGSGSSDVPVGLILGLCLTLFIILLILLILLWRFKKNKGSGSLSPPTGRQQNTSQSCSGPGSSLSGPSLLQPGSDQVYANVGNRISAYADLMIS